MSRRTKGLLIICLVILFAARAGVAKAYAASAERVSPASPIVATPTDPDPGTTPDPDPEPDPGTTPDPDPEPDPGTTPDPDPEPDPGTTPDPDPDPTPDPEPDPTPDPDPEPTPDPDPDPDPTPDPDPDPNPDPNPDPTPDPEPDPTPEPEPTPDPEPTPPPQPVYVDTRLSSLSIACGPLTPAFSPDVYAYTVYVTTGQSQKSCDVTAAAMDMNAYVTMEGPLTFTNQDVTRIITVSGNGYVSYYTITVHVITAREKLVDGQLYTVSDQPDVSVLPGDFTVGATMVGSERMMAAQSMDGQMILVQYTTTTGGKPIWYRYDRQSKKLRPASIVEHDGEKYILIAGSKDFLYGNNNGEGRYYVFDNETGEWLFRTERYDSLDVQPVPENDKLIVAWCVAGAFALLTAAAGAWIVRSKLRARKKVQKTKYFRQPYFTAGELDVTESRPMEEQQA